MIGPVLFTVKLSGAIKESNGILNGRDPNQIAWNMDGDQPLYIHASSVIWNWLNLEIMTGLMVLLALIVLIILRVSFYKQSHKKQQYYGQRKFYRFMEGEDGRWLLTIPV